MDDDSGTGQGDALLRLAQIIDETFAETGSPYAAAYGTARFLAEELPPGGSTDLGGERETFDAAARLIGSADENREPFGPIIVAGAWTRLHPETFLDGLLEQCGALFDHLEVSDAPTSFLAEHLPGLGQSLTGDATGAELAAELGLRDALAVGLRLLTTLSYGLTTAATYPLGAVNLARYEGERDDDELDDDDAFNRVMVAYTADREIAAAAPRTPSLADGPLVPGDVAALRAAHAVHLIGAAFTIVAEHPEDDALHGEHSEIRMRTTDVMRAIEATLLPLLEATPFYLPAHIAEAVANSELPDSETLDQLRLPYPEVLAMFGEPLRIDADSEILSQLRGPLRWMRDSFFTLDSDDLRVMALITGERFRTALVTSGASLHGVVLHANHDYTLSPEALYLLSAVHPDGGVEHRAIPGSAVDGALADVAANGAANGAWGDWSTPEEERIDRRAGTAAVRDQVRRGKHRRREASGGPLGVHVIDVARTAAGGTTGAHTGRSVVTHMRRGHWRRVRCGPRDAWRHEGRWIPPTVVNAACGEPGTRRVYRIGAHRNAS